MKNNLDIKNQTCKHKLDENGLKSLIKKVKFSSKSNADESIKKIIDF